MTKKEFIELAKLIEDCINHDETYEISMMSGNTKGRFDQVYRIYLRYLKGSK